MLLSVTAGVIAVGAGTVAVVGFGWKSNDTPRATAAPAATATVARATLTVTEREIGTLGHGAATPVGSRLVGTVTWLPSAGVTVVRGGALFKVDNSPVVLLYGPLPMFRELAPGALGADVKQFEREPAGVGLPRFHGGRQVRLGDGCGGGAVAAGPGFPQLGAHRAG